MLASSRLRILLWDIDGTLLRSARRGAFKDYTVPVLLSVFGTAGRLPEMVVSGMTDLQIVAEALRDEGFTPERIRERLDELKARYMQEMERATSADPEFFYLLPGAREALEATARHARYLNALLTGNIEPAAHLKMQLVGLSDYFTLPGAFGDESHDRRDLPALAAARINAHLNLDLPPTNSSSSATRPTTSPAPSTSARRPSPSTPAACTRPRTSSPASPTPCSQTSPTWTS